MIPKRKVESVKNVMAASDRPDSQKILNILSDVAKTHNSSPKRSFGLCRQIGFVRDVRRLGGDLFHFRFARLSKRDLKAVRTLQLLSI